MHKAKPLADGVRHMWRELFYFTSAKCELIQISVEALRVPQESFFTKSCFQDAHGNSYNHIAINQ